MPDLALDHGESAAIPLYRQLYQQLRDLILAGAFPAGSRLPAVRVLASEQRLARVTVAAAYKQLEAEGYVASRVGAGTFVAGVVQNRTVTEPDPAAQFRPALSRWGRRVMEAGPGPRPAARTIRPAIDFGFGRSFPHIFPYEVWRRLLDRYLSTDDVMLSRYGSVAGFTPLREAVAGYLREMRGVHCAAEQVVIVGGMQQALDVLARLLLNEGDEVVVETPGYADAFELFRSFGARLTALPVDDAGFPVERLPAGRKPRFAFVTPSNQFPRGGTLPLARRVALLGWARQTGALILEDDYDGELRYSDHPIAALQGLDGDGRVVYLGTFSKVLFPALRLGYVVLPPALAGPFVQALELVDRGAPTLTQAAVADFISEGHFGRHLRRLRKEYGHRRETLVAALEARLPGVLAYSREAAGLHVMLFLPEGMSEPALVEAAAAAGVGVYPGAPYHLERPAPPSILLGFSGLSEEEIREGVDRLAAAVSQVQSSPALDQGEAHAAST
jgi:GntR family transcriptional regulator/MocR family aminotransferase